ncbi:MAG: hypothetical protein Q9214_007747 [Letrouitia sp. 1 TL-2023]
MVAAAAAIISHGWSAMVRLYLPSISPQPVLSQDPYEEHQSANSQTPHDRKIPWRLSKTQKARQRQRLRAVDNVVATLDNALRKQGSSLKELERWKTEMPTEDEMRPKDKYTVFDRKEKKYRKGIHSEFLLLSSFFSYFFGFGGVAWNGRR